VGPLSPQYGASTGCERRGNLQQCKVAANIFNKHLRTNDKGGPPSWGFGVGLTTPQHKKQACYKKSERTLDLDGFFG
jgi:hypothetical protein